MTLPSPEEQQKIDALAQEVMTELRRVSNRVLRIEIVRSTGMTVAIIGVLVFLWWVS